MVPYAPVLRLTPRPELDRLDVGATYYEMALLVSHGQDGHLFLLHLPSASFSRLHMARRHAPVPPRAKTEVHPAIPLTPAAKKRFMIPGPPIGLIDAGHHDLPALQERPNHFLKRAKSLAVFARKFSLHVSRQKRRPRWWWQIRPNFPPQFAQRFSSLVMRLSPNWR
jgi:hypothetical protein